MSDVMGREPAFPMIARSAPEFNDGHKTGRFIHLAAGGMTKREAFALAAMQGAISADPELDAGPAAAFAVKAADALLAELAKDPQP